MRNPIYTNQDAELCRFYPDLASVPVPRLFGAGGGVVVQILPSKGFLLSRTTYWILPPDQIPAISVRTGEVIIVPGLDVVQSDLPAPGLLVIHSDALDNGPWATAHIAEGTGLADELLRWIGVVHAQGGRALYAVTPDFAPGVNNNAIVSAVDTVAPVDRGANLIEWVAQHGEQEAER